MWVPTAMPYCGRNQEYTSLITIKILDVLNIVFSYKNKWKQKLTKLMKPFIVKHFPELLKVSLMVRSICF